MAATANDLLTKFHTWANSYKESFVSRAGLAADLSEDKETIQGDVFWEDLSRGMGASVRGCAYETATLAQSLAAIPLSVLAPFGELYRAASREISFGTSLSHIIRLPEHVLFAIFEIIRTVGRSLKEIWSGAETGTGFIAWHSGEWLARSAFSQPHSVLSQIPAVRSVVVYQSVGAPLLALGYAFVPIASVQVMALTVLSARVFEITNSLLGMQDCPAYYDATAKVIRTNHWLIKPLVAGSELVMMATKIAALIFALIHTLPYSSEKLPLSWVASSMVGGCLGGLLIAQLASMMKKNFLENRLNEYAALVGMEWSEDLLKQTWGETKDSRGDCILAKQSSLLRGAEIEAPHKIFNARCKWLTDTLEGAIADCDFPAKETMGFETHRISIGDLAGWRACWERERTGMWMLGFAGLTAAVVNIIVRRHLHLKAILQRY